MNHGDDDRVSIKINSEVNDEPVETVEVGDNGDIRRHKTRRGLAFLRRTWTVHEILTSGLFFEVFGFVSTFFHSMYVC